MILERIRCTNCGAEFVEYDPQATLFYCKSCKATFIIRQARAFAKVQIDHDQDIITLRKLMDDAFEQRDSDALWNRANAIRKYIPDDFYAGFCEALARKNQGKTAAYYHFLKASYKNTTTAESLNWVFEKAFLHFDIHDYDALMTFIRTHFQSDEALKKKSLIEKAVQETIEKEERYSEFPRDIFICHSSDDQKLAMEVYHALIADGNSCWISYRNLPPDTINYWERIAYAIQHAKIIIVVSSLQCMLRDDPKREVRIAHDANIRKVEYKIDDSKHTNFFKYYFDGLQWVDGRKHGKDSLAYLCDRVFRELEIELFPVAAANTFKLKTQNSADVRGVAKNSLEKLQKHPDNTTLNAAQEKQKKNKQNSVQIYKNANLSIPPRISSINQTGTKTTQSADDVHVRITESKKTTNPSRKTMIQLNWAAIDAMERGETIGKALHRKVKPGKARPSQYTKAPMRLTNWSAIDALESGKTIDKARSGNIKTKEISSLSSVSLQRVPKKQSSMVTKTLFTLSAFCLIPGLLGLPLCLVPGVAFLFPAIISYRQNRTK